MNQALLLLSSLLLITLVKSQTDLKQDVFLASQAIAQIIDKMSRDHMIRFEIIIERNDYISEKIVEKVHSFLSSPIELIKLHDILSFRYEFGTSYLLISKKGIYTDIVNLRGFIRRIRDLHYEDLHKRYLTFYGPSMLLNYAYDEDIFAAAKHKNICNSIPYNPYQPNRIFQLAHHERDSKKELHLFNCVQFQEQKCEPEWNVINEFSVGDLKWKSNKFLLNYTSFKKCEIRVLITYDKLLLSQRDESNFVSFFNANLVKGKIIMGGLFGDFFNLFAEVKEIVYKHEYPTESASLSEHFPEIHYWYFGHPADTPSVNEYYNTMELTTPIFFIPLSFIVTPGIRLSPVENLYMPFDFETWISLFSSFAVGIFSITVVKMCSSKVMAFVFGRNNDDPILNMAQIFFGIGLVKISGQDFARYLFMMFTLFCLVMRNAYQGKMFEFITGDLRHPKAETVQDIFDMELPIIINGDNNNTFNNEKLI